MTVLSSWHMLQVEVDKSYKSDWTKEQFDGLKEGDYSDPSNGTKLEDILKDHPKASNAEYSITTTRQGEFKKEMTISYSDYEAEDGKLKRVYLSFDTKEGNHIEGTNLYLLTQNPNVEGLEAIKLFVPRSIALPKGMELNKKVNVEFNHKGKLVKISLA